MGLNWISDSFRLLAQGFGFCFLKAPKSRTPVTGFGSFVLLAIFFVLLFTGMSYLKAGKDSFFMQSSYGAYALLVLAILAASAIAATFIQRRPLWLSLASITLVFVCSWTLLLEFWERDTSIYQTATSDAARIVLVIILLCLGRLYSHFMKPRSLWAVIPAALLTLALCFSPWQQSMMTPLFFSMEAEEEYGDEYLPDRFDVEAVFSSQPAVLQKQLDGIADQRPDKIDLYAIGVAGQDDESVFRNEVEYLQKLLPQRFDAQYLPLINTLDDKPGTAIASVSNLRQALLAYAGKMDRKQDILLLYLTSHGGKDHTFVMQMGNLPLTQITPESLKRMLDETGIEHQVVIISACYSGGYIEPLRSEHRLVLTAARKDRTSFGCGADSKITWFGKAFWAEAMNNTNDMEAAFNQAKRSIGVWEKQSGNIASEPQIGMGSEIRTYLSQWQEQFPLNRPPVLFGVAPSAKARPAATGKSEHH